MTLPSGSPAPLPPGSFVPPTAEELGVMLPHYEISHLIAAGGMGAVYGGMQRALDRAVAIKILPPDAARDGESIGRFRTEAKAMARLTHPNIPAVYDFDVSGGYCYLVMEYIDGWNVHQLITEGGLNPSLTFSLLSQVCDALHFAHQRGIVHGDIKPSNLLVTQEGTVKLADFGLARLTGSREAETYVPMGTPEYAAPELWQEGVVMDHRADLYSLGCLFYEMLTGAAPQGEFLLPAAALQLDPRVDTVIARCMQPTPELRYQSASEIKLAIDAIRQPSPGKAPVNPAVRIVRPPARRPGQATGARRRAKPAGASPVIWLVLTGLAVACAVLVLKGKSDPAAAPGVPEKAPLASDSAAPPQTTTTADNATPPPPPPVLPPPERATALPVPPPLPAPSIPGLTPETQEKLTAFRAKYRADWQAAVAGKLTTERDRLGTYYLAALEKFRGEAAKAGDAAALRAVGAETVRFQKSREGVSADQQSSIVKLATLQKTLTTSWASAEARIKPAADQLRERCLLELKAIQATAASSDQDMLSRLYDGIVSTPDLASVLAD